MNRHGNAATSEAPPDTSHRPWYREMYVWLLILIPATALIAGAVTLILAVQGADVEVPRSDESNLTK